MWFNIGSLVLGLGAWVLAILAISAPAAINSHRNTLLSFGLCVGALVFQMLEISRRVRLGDFAAVDDNIRVVLIASVVLAGVTMALNVGALLKAKEK